MIYNYHDEMLNDVKNWCVENYDELQEYQTPDELSEYLYDTLFCEDSVTGNGSGSYTFNRDLARNMVKANSDILKSALNEFCVPPEEIGKRFLDEDFEYFDVTIRCYLLSYVINDYIEELKDEKYF